MAQIEATTLITFNPPSIREEQSLADALDWFCQWQLTEIAVINRQQQVQGILQLSAVLELIAQDAEVSHCNAGQHISARPDPFQLCRFPRVALQQLLADGYRTLPVVEDGKLIGTLGRSDFLREFAMSGSRLASSGVLDHTVPAGEGLEASASIAEAFEFMAAERRDDVAVVQSGFPLAATTRDELNIAVQLARAEEIVARQPERTRNVIQLIRPAPHLQPGQSIAEAAQTMSETGAMALLVVNKAKRILGLITETMILKIVLRSGCEKA